MTLQDYNAHPGISASAIKQGRASMLQMRHAMITPRDTDEPSPAMRWGTLAHLALLQPVALATSVVIRPETYTNEKGQIKEWNSNANACKLWVEKNKGKLVATEAEIGCLDQMRAAMLANADARHFMSRVEAVEVPMVWARNDVGLCKGRPDCIGDAFLGDYKTAREIDKRALFSQFHRLGYLHQMAWYMDGLQRTTGKQIHVVWVLVQQSVAPYECGVIDIPIKLLLSAMGDGLAVADDTCLVIARQYRICEALGSFPGRYSGAVEYEPPAWSVAGLDEVNLEGVGE